MDPNLSSCLSIDHGPGPNPGPLNEPLLGNSESVGRLQDSKEECSCVLNSPCVHHSNTDLTHSHSVKMQIGLLAETPETRSSLGCGTWPQLMCCALVAVRVPEVGRGQVRASEQGGSSDDDQDK